MPRTPAFAAVVLAAGGGTRMKSTLPKPVLPLLDKPMVHHVLEAVRAAGAEPVVVVVGHQAERVRAALPSWCRCALQPEQLGTGHALQCARAALGDWAGPVLVIYADTPLIQAATISRLLDMYYHFRPAAALLTVELPDGGSYGRIVRNSHGLVEAIVEAADCSPGQLAIREINVGTYVFEAPAIFEVLCRLQGNNAKGELYLTDAVGLLREDGGEVRALLAPDPGEALGVNTLEELQAAAQVLAARPGARPGGGNGTL